MVIDGWPSPVHTAWNRPGAEVAEGQDAMTEYVEKAGLRLDPLFEAFIEQEALPGTGIAPDVFWTALAGLLHDFTPRNRALLKTREDLQARIDTFEFEHRGKRRDAAEVRSFLEAIGYLVPE